MQFAKIALLLSCLTVAAYAQVDDVVPARALNPLDVRAANLKDDVPSSEVAVPEKKAVPAIVIGICQIHDVVTAANITHEQVADFILNHTPAKYRSKLYDEFINGGTEFVAKLTNVGCSLLKVKTILSKMWPFGRLYHVMQILNKPFGGLQKSEEYAMLHDAIDYIDQHQGEEALNLIPETFCYVRNQSFARGNTKEQVIAEVEKRMPEPLRKSFVDKILRFGVKGVARLADVGCKVLPVHVEIDVKNTVVSEENSMSHIAVRMSGDVNAVPAAFPLLFGSAAFCELHKQLQNRGINHEKIIELINRIIPKPFRGKMIEKFTNEGVDKLALLARIGCKVMPRLHIAEMESEMLENEVRNDVVTAGLKTDVIVLKETFCQLVKAGQKMGATKTGVSHFIRVKFPNGWRQHLLGKLFEDGLLEVVNIAHRMCFVSQ